MARPRTGSGASEDLEGVQMQGMTGAVNPASHVPTETIREKDEVSIQLFVVIQYKLMIGNGCRRLGVWG